MRQIARVGISGWWFSARPFVVVAVEKKGEWSMPSLKPSRFEAHLALRHPEVRQLPGKAHDELLGWIERRGICHVMQLQFGFGIVKVLCSSNGLSVYEALTALLDDFDTILAAAKQDMLKSPEFDEAARASIVIDTVPRDVVIAPESQFYSIGIQCDWGYYLERRDDLGESICIYPMWLDGRMVYDAWGTSTTGDISLGVNRRR